MSLALTISRKTKTGVFWRRKGWRDIVIFVIFQEHKFQVKFGIVLIHLFNKAICLHIYIEIVHTSENRSKCQFPEYLLLFPLYTLV